MKKEWEKIISECLSVKPLKINSNLVSAQNRNRLYWTNIHLQVPLQDKNILLESILENYNFPNAPYEINYISSRPIQYTKSKFRTLVANGGSKTRGVGISNEYGYWRKLTPIECERLQTIPENYTNIASDPQRYKMLGNAWTVDVIVHILKGMGK